MTPTERVRVRAPVRALDAGGWTDTWFAGGGTVCSLAMDDGVDVVAERAGERRAGGAGVVELVVPSFDDVYRFALDAPPGRHPLLEATLRCWAPADDVIRVTVTSSVPPGSGLGTSAAVVVALIAALDALRGEPRGPAALAAAAHEIETVELGIESGVQDQVAAAHGGANLIAVDPYPEADVHALELTDATWASLEARLVTAYLGSPHRSGAIHDEVIRRLMTKPGAGPFTALRDAARAAAAALVAGDLDGYGAAMVANTEAQAALHPGLVGDAARAAIARAERAGAIGWKVNGAGGDGGTVTFVTPPDPGAVRDAVASIEGFTILALRPGRRGARVVVEPT